MRLPMMSQFINKDRIELAKINLMIDEGREFSLKDSVPRIEKVVIKQAMKKHRECQAKIAQSIGLTNRAIQHILISPR
jgi:transcriptional regulator with PAS, ATPase and Fis domain